jgi:eukaryotic-like serine/threonine-protein kinase
MRDRVEGIEPTLSATLPPEGLLFRIGEMIGDAYEIRGLLGEGGMAQVFDAYDRLLNRRVAIKAAAKKPTDGESPLRLEAQALAAVRHPCLVTVHGMGIHRGIEYLILERIYGMSLHDHIQLRHRSRRQFSLPEALAILIALADGLAAVHRAGGAHRDVKPSNIMLAPGNRVVLMDLGIFHAESSSHPTMAAGTPHYMAPEVITNEVELGQWHLVDLYSLGVVAYEILAGQRPYEGNDIYELFHKHTYEPIPDLIALRRDVPPRLRQLIVELMGKAPSDRPPDAELVARELRAIRNGGQAAAKGRRITDPEDRAVRFHVLIVDDDRDAQELLRHTVQRAIPWAAIECARSAESALQSVSRVPPDILLLDLRLPRMSGIELLMYLRGTSVADGCHVIAVSGEASERDHQLLDLLGVAHSLTKGPRLVDELAVVLGEARRRATRQK